MRRVAANKVYFSPTTAYPNHILEICGKRIVNHFGLEDELELTEWLGGIIIIADEKTVSQFVDDIRQTTFTPSHLDDILQYIYSTPKPNSPRENSGNRKIALHLSGIDVSMGKILDKIIPVTLVEPDLRDTPEP